MKLPKNYKIITTNVVLLSAMSTMEAYATEFDLSNGWKGSVGLQIQAFLTNIDDNIANESSSRIQSGFDPSKLTIGVKAPEYNGLNVSGTFQLVQAIQGAKDQGDDGGTKNEGVRIAKVSIGGSFGTLKFGRDIAIFGLDSLAHDTGSLPGVGRGASVDGGGATAGRINYGYYYPDFHAGIQYHSNSYGGFSFQLGIFDPIDIKDDASTSADESTRAEELRIEGAASYKSEPFDIWVSFIDQGTESQAEISGYDLGGEVRLGPVALTAAFSDGTGIQCCGPSANDFEQWYTEADVTIGETTIGASYGENELSNPEGNSVSEGELIMVFVHHNLTPTLTLIAEWNNETVSPSGGGEDITDTDTIAFGVNWQF